MHTLLINACEAPCRVLVISHAQDIAEEIMRAIKRKAIFPSSGMETGYGGGSGEGATRDWPSVPLPKWVDKCASRVLREGRLL